MNWFVDWLAAWQTLTAGVLAVCAAVGGAYLLLKQIGQAEAHEATRRNRRHNAVRATLPLTLSGLIDYATSVTKALLLLRPKINDMGEYDGEFPSINPPITPVELVPALQEMIEATDDQKIVNLISQTIGQLQILNARIHDLNRNIAEGGLGVELNIDDYIVDAAIIYAMASAMFKFARRQDESVPAVVTWEEVAAGLNLMGVRSFDFPEIYQIVTRQARLNVSTFLGDD